MSLQGRCGQCSQLSGKKASDTEELVSSNTDGTHGKLPLDSNKLNFLKVLVFSKFPVECAVEKEKLWKFIKTKINDRCRALKFAKREH